MKTLKSDHKDWEWIVHLAYYTNQLVVPLALAQRLIHDLCYMCNAIHSTEVTCSSHQVYTHIL